MGIESNLKKKQLHIIQFRLYVNCIIIANNVKTFESFVANNSFWALSYVIHKIHQIPF